MRGYWIHPGAWVGVVLAGCVMAEEAPVAELPGTLDLATSRSLLLEYNPRIRQARERLNEQEGVILEQTAARMPRLGAGGNYTVTDDSLLEDFGGTSVDDTSWRADAEAALTVYAGGTIRATIESARLSRDALAMEAVTTEQDLLLQLHESFYGALLARQTIEVEEASVDLLEEQLALSSNRFAAGAGPKFDVIQAEVALANKRPVVLQARNQFNVRLEEIRRWIGLPAPDRITIEGEWNEVAPAPAVAEALAIAKKNRPELKDLALRQEAGEQDVRVAGRQLRPRVDVFAGYGFQNDRFSEDSEYLDGWTTGVRATWDLWDGRESRGRLRQSRSRLLQLELEEQDLALQIENDVRENVYTHQVAADIVVSTEKVILQAEEALRLARNRFKAGAARQLDVLQQQVELTRARLQYANAQYALHLARARLLRSMGDL